MKIDISKSDIHQQKAITGMDSRKIVVGASAGAGKTRVLVTRILRLCLEERIPLERITALTFTEAAAQEMKNRLAKDLYEFREKTDDPEEAAYIDSQILALVQANITTIDSWCLSILKKYSSLIGLDPACTQNILSSGADEMISRRAFEECLKEAAEKDKESILSLLTYFTSRSEEYDTLYKIVRTVNLAAQSLDDPDAWYAKAAGSYRPFRTLKDLDPEAVSGFLEYYIQYCMEIRNNCTALLARVEETGEKKLKREQLIPLINILNDCIRLLEEGDYTGYTAKLPDLAACKTSVPADKDILAPLRKEINEQIKDLAAVSWPVETLRANSPLQSQIARTLIGLCRQTAARARALRIENVSLNFADMERLALDILRADSGSAAEELHASVDEILVDEFQDTSVLQDTIIRTIAKDTRIFRVGDVKQSIYRFRQAKPQLMRDLLESDDASALSLRYNYRSRSNIIAFTNLLFSRLMNIEGLQDSYTEADTVSPGTDKQIHGEETAGATLVLLKDPDPAYTAGGKQKAMKASSAKMMKAGWIAAKIRQMKAEDPSVSYRDFAVLSRAHGDQIVLKRMFEKYGIPYDIDAREGFYQSDLCRNTLAMFNVILHPEDTLSWLAVLTSPLCRMSDEDIASMVLRNQRNLLTGLRKEQPQLLQTVQHWREVNDFGSPADVLSAIANTKVQYNGITAAYYDILPANDKANFDYLFERALTSGYTRLRYLADEILQGTDEKSSEAITSGRDDDTVTATTIHHSKGLQYKYVFLWGTGSSRDTGASGAVLVNDELTIGLKDTDPRYRIVLPTVQRIAVQQRNTMEDLEEFSRLLYVAVTRAEERLWIVDEEASAADRVNHPDITLLKKRPGITGLVTALLDHAEGLNENGLFEVIREEYTDTSALYGTPASHTFIPPEHMTARIQLLPQIQTPSALEEQPAGRAYLPPLGLSKAGASYGTRLHALVEKLPDDTEWTEELIRSMESEEVPDAMAASLLTFSRSSLYRQAKTMEIHKEYPFYFETEKTRMNGTMDLFAIGRTEIILIDFKTDRKTPEQIREVYTPQLSAYIEALHYFYPDHTVRAYAWSFHNNCAVPIEK